MRTELAPDLPTVAELLDFTEITDTLSKALLEVMQDEELQKSILAANAAPTPSDRDEFAKLVQAQYDLWGEMVSEAEIPVQ